MICKQCKEYEGWAVTMTIVDSFDAIYVHADKVYQCPDCFYEEPCHEKEQ